VQQVDFKSGKVLFKVHR